MEESLNEAKKKVFNSYKTKSFVGLSVSIDKNMIKVTDPISGDEKEFEDHVTIVKEKSDRDFYVFIDNLE